MARASVIQKFHRNQQLVHDTPARFKVIVAGRRWGKTAFCKIQLILEAARKPGSLIWYVAPTYSMAQDIMWAQLLAAIPRSWLAKKPHDTKLTIWLKNGAVIQLKGADKPDSLRGRGVDLVVLDEYQDFKLGTWDDVLFPLLADRAGRAIIIGTPKAYNHLYELYRRGQDKKDDGTPVHPDWASWQFPTSTSPFIPKKELDTARANMDERSFKQEFEASFETMSGRVYYAFDRNTHVGDFPFDPNNYIIVGQDFNVDPMSSVILQYKKDTGEIWAVDEIVLNQSNTQETIDEIERRYFRLFPHRVVVFPDPAGGNRSSARGESDLQIFREKGITRIHYHKKHPFVSDRINAVNSMLKSADGTIRLRVDRKCKKLIESLEQVIYKPGTRDVDKSQNNEHITDALGYPIEFMFPVRRIPLIGVSR